MTDQWWTSDPIVSPAPQAAPQAPRAQPRPVAPQIRFADARDALARTLIGEAGNQGDEGMLAVGGVVMNRARQRGLPPEQVVLERNQFEPWGNPETARRLLSISPDSPEYRRAAALADRVLQGEDVTGGASHFYAPKAQAALGRPKPAWDNGTGRAIGDHLFFNLDGPAQADVQMTGNAAPADAWWAADPVATEVVDTFPQEQASQGPIEVEIDQGVANVNGRAMLGDQDLGPWEKYWAGQAKDRADREARLERLENPEYQRALADARAGSENVPDWLRAFGQGQTLGFLDEINASAQGALQGLENATRNVTGRPIEYSAAMAAQAARDSERDAARRFAAERPLTNFGLELAGGLLTPGLKGGGEYISGATGTARLGRAGAVGSGYGLLSGAGHGEGDLIERAPDAAQGALVGAGAGVVGQRATDALFGRAARAASNPSPQRAFSQRGGLLTPGQMAGGGLKTIEEGLTSTPILGDFIRDGQRRAVGSFDTVAINEALSPIGQRISASTAPGRGAIKEADSILSAEYSRILDPLTVAPDEAFTQRLSQITSPANMSGNTRERLNDVVNDVLARFDGPIDGRTWKQIDSELGSLINSAQKGDVANRPLAGALRDVRQAFNEVLERTDPEAAAAKANADAAYANFERVRKAASNPTTARNEGLFSPANLNSVLARTEGRAYAQGEARLQDLTDEAVDAIGATLPDSGTPLRSALQVALPGAAGATVLGQGWVPILYGAVSALGALGYGQTGQRLLNAAYRSTSPGSMSSALGELSRLAQRDPALLPYYEELSRLALGGLLSPERNSQPAPQGLLSPTPVP